MKNFTLLILLVLATVLGMAQPAIDFETGGKGAAYAWSTFENGDNPALEIVANPSATGINTSAKVAKFTARQAGQPYAGTQTAHGDFGTFTLSASNSTVKMMVYKSYISDVALQFSISSDGAQPPLKVANTKINEWEELTFDFSSYIGTPQTINIDRIIVFPDWTARPADRVAYFDNITFSAKTTGGGTPSEPTVAATTPTRAAGNVKSIFSNAYTNVATPAGFIASWSAGALTSIQVAGNDVKKITALDFVGIEPTASIDATGMTTFHVDYWTSNITAFRVKLVDYGENGIYQGSPNDDVEHELEFVPTAGQWNYLEIPLSSFTGLTKKGHIAQIIFKGLPAGGTVYLDNIYFHNEAVTPPPASEPTVAATTPTRAAGNVKSIFSNAYTNVATPAGFIASWSAGALTSIQVAGNDVKKVTALDFVGIEPTASIDATGMTTFHVDYWTSNITAFRVKLVDYGENGIYQGSPNDDVEHELEFVPTAGQWNYLEIPLSSFTGLTKKGHIAQIIFKGLPAGGTVYLDNIYFHSEAVTPPPASEPTVAATTPTRAAGNVKSIFSNAYTNVATPAGFIASWSAGALTSIQVAGNDVKKITALDFVGIEPTASIDATGMTTFHVDYWTSNITAFRVKLVDYGENGIYQGSPNDDVEHELEFVPTAGQWNYLEIPLSSFTGLTKKGHIAQIIFKGLPAGGTVYLDNIYFHNEAVAPNLTQMNLPVTFDDATVNYGLVGFGGAENSTIVVDPTLATNKVAKVVKSAGAQTWAGTTITAVNGNAQTGFSSKVPFTATNKKMNIRVWSPNAGIVIRLKVEDANNENRYVEVDVTNTIANNWEVLTFDFANPATAAFDASFNYNKASIFFNFGVAGATAGEKTYYFDDVNFGAPKQAQTITFAAPADKTFGDAAFTLTATASSSLAVAFTTTTSDKITLAGTQVTLVKAGRASVTALQSGNDSYLAATPVTQTFCIKPAKPTITTGTASATSVTLTSSASAGNQWYLNGTAITGATNSTYTATTAGTYKVQVKVDDCISDFSADNVITKSSQTITFPAITTKTLTSAAFTLGATASSGLAVTYATSSTDKITLVGNQVTAVKAAGKATITATQTGNDLVASATAVSVDFCITPAKPTITTSGVNTAATVLTSSATTGNQWYLNGTAISGATSATYTIAAAGIYKVQVTIDGCASDFSTESTFIVTGDLASQNNQIGVYPNPVENQLQINGLSGDSYTTSVYDLTGRASTIVLEKVENSHKANVQHLQQGIYVLAVQEGNQSIKLKFIKK